VPAYVERSTEVPSALAAEQQERAKVDIALLFRGTSTSTASEALTASVVSPTGAPWSPIQQYFPHLDQTVGAVTWPLRVSAVESADFDAAVSPEWGGWRDYRGLGVHGTASDDAPQAPAATLEFETLGRESPLVLSAEGSSLVLTNRSDTVVERALLIYSHPGGVGVTAVSSVDPGQRVLTALGPKEHPPETLLALAREQLTNFFSASAGPELASAMASAKSIPFLETQGLRVIALLAADREPASVSFSSPLALQRHVVVSHSEILKPEEEARVLSTVTTPTLTVEQAVETLGRFTEAKLEFAAQSSDAAVSAKSTELLSELRRR
jgi:hypothetical protein